MARALFAVVNVSRGQCTVPGTLNESRAIPIHESFVNGGWRWNHSHRLSILQQSNRLLLQALCRYFSSAKWPFRLSLYGSFVCGVDCHSGKKSELCRIYGFSDILISTKRFLIEKKWACVGKAWIDIFWQVKLLENKHRCIARERQTSLAEKTSFKPKRIESNFPNIQ